MREKSTGSNKALRVSFFSAKKKRYSLWVPLSLSLLAFSTTCFLHQCLPQRNNRLRLFLAYQSVRIQSSGRLTFSGRGATEISINACYMWFLIHLIVKLMQTTLFPGMYTSAVADGSQ